MFAITIGFGLKYTFFKKKKSKKNPSYGEKRQNYIVEF